MLAPRCDRRWRLARRARSRSCAPDGVPGLTRGAIVRVVVWQERAWRCVGLAGMLCSCAAGVEGDGSPFGTVPSTQESTGDDGSTSSDVITTGITESASDSGIETTGASTGDDAESTTGDDGSSTGEPDDGSSTGDDTGSSVACSNALTCATASVLGMVSGDESSPNLQAMGTEPTWLAFRVSEDNDSPIGESLSFTATLQSPAGYDFDLYVWRGADGASNGCNGTLQQSTAASGPDVVHMDWGEAGVANGSDDGRWIAVEIRSKDGICDPNAAWTLLVEGDT
jgi:hypothetical protein